MKERTDSRLPAAALLLAMVLLAVWCFWTLTTSHSYAKSAAMNFVKCEQLAGKIRSLRKTSIDQPADQAGSPAGTDLGELLRRASPSLGVLRIDPQPVRRIQNSDWVEQTASVTLRSITIQELAVLLGSLAAGDSDIRASYVRMVQAEDEPAGMEERWDVEMTLTHSLFSPKSGRMESSG